MEMLIKILNVFLIIIEKVGPTIAVLIAVYLGYRYAKKQKVLENRYEDEKKIRTVVSNLLLIWRELSTIEYYVASDEFYAGVLFKDAKLAANYFNMDLKRVQTFETLFNESKDQLKSINSVLFYELEDSYRSFQKSFKYFVDEDALKKAKEQELRVLLKDMLVHVVRELETIIKETSMHLPHGEQKGIVGVIELHQEILKNTDFDYEVPTFLLNMVNSFFPVIEPITSEETKIFVSSTAVKMAFAKIAPFVISVFVKKNPIATLQNLFAILKNPTSLESQIDVEDIIVKLEISDEENDLLKKNPALYKMICAVYKKFSHTIPYKFKRTLLEINNGTIDVKRLHELRKSEIILRRYAEELDKGIE